MVLKGDSRHAVVSDSLWFLRKLPLLDVRGLDYKRMTEDFFGTLKNRAVYTR